MSKRGNGYRSENRVNILKKVKVGLSWNLYPVVVEPNAIASMREAVRWELEDQPNEHHPDRILCHAGAMKHICDGAILERLGRIRSFPGLVHSGFRSGSCVLQRVPVRDTNRRRPRESRNE